MNTCTTTIASAPAGDRPLSNALAATLASWTRRFDAWRERRVRAARDREALAQMNDRELHDIGIGRGYRDFAASGAWTRDGWQ